MPTQRKIVMQGGFTPAERHEVMIKTAIELHEPYKVFRDPVKGDWVLVHDRPPTRDRVLIMDGITSKRTATDLRDLLSRAWAEGFRALRED